MKKIGCGMLCLFLSLCILTSCTAKPSETVFSDTTGDPVQTSDTLQSETTGKTETDPIYFQSPADEKKVTKTIETVNEDGMQMNVILHGYASESLGKDFYCKSGEYMQAEIFLSNTSENSYYQYLPNDCRHDKSPKEEKHNHEFAYHMANKDGYTLNRSTANFMCTQKWDIWEIDKGMVYDYLMKFAAGVSTTDKIDLPHSENNRSCGIKLYDGSLYGKDLSTVFTGEISFAYGTKEDMENKTNPRTVIVKAEVEFVYTGGDSVEALPNEHNLF